MKCLYIFLAVHCLITITEGKGKKIPEYLNPCKISDPKFKQCLEDSIQLTARSWRKGMIKDINKIEPATLQATTFNFTLNGMEVQAYMNETRIDNLSYFSINSIRTTENCYIIDLTITWAKLEANGSLVTPYVSADGVLLMEGDEIDMAMHLCGEEIKDRNGECRYHFNALDLRITMEEFNAEIHCKNGFKEKLINLGFSFSKQRIRDRSLPIVINLAKKQLLDSIQKMTDGFDCEDLRPQ